MEPKNLDVNSKDLQEAVLRHLPIALKNRVARKFPEFQDIVNNAPYDLKRLEIILNENDSYLTMKENATKDRWRWKVQKKSVTRKFKVNPSKDWKNVDRFELTGTIEKNFQKMIDFTLPKVKCTYFDIDGKLPFWQCTEKVKALNFSIRPDYPLLSLDRYMDLVDSSCLDLVVLDETWEGTIGNCLNHLALKKCQLQLFLRNFNVDNLTNVVSKNIEIYVLSSLDSGEVLQLASNFAATKDVGFVFTINERNLWDIIIKDIKNRPGWTQKYLGEVPCASYGHGKVEINIFVPRYSYGIQMKVMNRGFAKEEATYEKLMFWMSLDKLESFNSSDTSESLKSFYFSDSSGSVSPVSSVSSASSDSTVFSDISDLSDSSPSDLSESEDGSEEADEHAGHYQGHN